MIEVLGKYNSAKIFTDNVDSATISQIIELLNQDFAKDSRVRIMPDTHAGAGCVIGFTADLGDKVIPNIVGYDIGCGILTVELGQIDVDLKELDRIIYEYVPSGANTHDRDVVKFKELQDLHCYGELKDIKRLTRSVGTLGGGNHFIEVDKDDDNNLYLVIHSGSRNLGQQVAKYYQNIAIDMCKGKEDYYKERERIITEYKAQGKKKLIEQALKNLENKFNITQPKYPKDLCYLTEKYKDEYLHDMNICQEYATLNRMTMANIILKHLFNKDLTNFEHYTTIHNYINFKDNIIRKGSISAYEGEKVLIPINMRDGSLVCIGKGNADWNYSAPHGAGRILSRGKAKEVIEIDDYVKSMEGIYTTSVSASTIDESAFVYKPMEEIMSNIGDTVEICKIIKPIYNFKSA